MPVNLQSRAELDGDEKLTTHSAPESSELNQAVLRIFTYTLFQYIVAVFDNSQFLLKEVLGVPIRFSEHWLKIALIPLKTALKARS